MSGQKRGRACVACASIKIKCQLGSDQSLDPPCERCTRLGKECILSAPKRQKDRVAELEAQVAALTRLLQAQGLSGSAAESLTSSPTAAEIAGSGTTKKRRLSPTSADSPSAASSSSAVYDGSRLDEVVSRDWQQRALDKYFESLFPCFPLVPIRGDCTLDSMRLQRPLLLQAIIYAAGPNLLPVETQEDVSRLFLGHLAIARGKRQDRDLLELLQAVEIACLWFRSPKHHKHFTLFEMIQTASKLADELGRSGPLTGSLLPTARSWEDRLSDGAEIEINDAWRNWLVCHLLSTNMGILMRKPIQLDSYTMEAITYLEVSEHEFPTDEWLAQYFRVENLGERVIYTMQLTVPDVHLQLSDPATTMKIESCKNAIRDWRAIVPSNRRTPTIRFIEQLATVWMLEIVLHSPTNKHTFAAPYAPFCLSATDFPAPTSPQEYATSLYDLLSALHGAIDAYCDVDPAVLSVQCASIFAARVSYAHYLLAKLYIACTAPGNTFGSVLDISLLRINEYADKMIRIAQNVSLIAPEASPTRILEVAQRIKDFYETYNTSLVADNNVLQPIQVPLNSLDLGSFNIPTSQDFSSDQLAELDTFYAFPEGAADFGLDMSFTDPNAFEQFLSSYQQTNS